MAFVVTDHGSAFGVASATGVTLAGVTPTANARLYVVAAAGINAGTPAFTPSAPSFSGSGVGAFSLIDDEVATVTWRFGVALWAADVGASPTTGSVTSAWSDAVPRHALRVFDITGHDPSTPEGTPASARIATATHTLALGGSPAADSAVIAVGIAQGDDDAGTGTTYSIDPDAAFTKVGGDVVASTGSSSLVLTVATDITAPDADVDWSSLSNDARFGNALLLVEVLAAGGGGPGPSAAGLPIHLFHNRAA